MGCSGGRGDNYCAPAFSEKWWWGDLVSPVADRYSRDQKKLGEHDDPIRLKCGAEWWVPGFEMHQRELDRYLRLFRRCVIDAMCFFGAY